MRKRFNICSCAVYALIFLPLFSHGQNIPSLSQDSNISRGELPDGIVYYLVENRTVKGVADFALVQKLHRGDTLADVAPVARKALDRLPRFCGQNAVEFMARNSMTGYGISPSSRDWVADVREDAVIYRFGTLPSSRGETAVDSTLLMIFGIMERTGEYAPDFPTSSNAIIISGDIDRAAMQKRLQMLSLMLPARRQASVPEDTYRWQPSDSAICMVTVDSSSRFSTVKAIYSSPRTPAGMMGTVLPLVSGRLGDMMGTILKKRLYTEMKRAGVPLAYVGYRYYRSTEQPGDEKYEVSIHTDSRHTEKAVRIMAGVLADMDVKGVLPKEFSDARGEYLIKLYGQSLAPIVSNGTYIDECISSFLYGSDLSSKEDRFRFFVRGRMVDTTQTRMFNSFVSELIDSTSNLTLSVKGDSAALTEAELMENFVSGWKERTADGSYISYAANQNDSIAMSAAPEKTRVRLNRKDPVSGGTLWRFANGVNVVYKRMTTGGLFYYTMVIRGGYSAMPDIKRGEGAFLSDLLETYNICGMKPEDFNSLMLSNGITMSSKVGLSDMRLYGMAPRPSLTLLMKSLAAVANGRSIDPGNFEYYRECEKIWLESRRNTLPDRVAAIDSLMCPSYNYSSEKTLQALYPDLQERAMKFFDDQFSRVNDGVIIIVGDMEETAMMKFLQKHVGAFRTREHGSVRVKLPYQPISGWTTYTVDGPKTSVDVAMSSAMKFSSGNYMAARVASLAVKDAVNSALCGKGISLRVSSSLAMYPQERFNMMISVEDAPLDKFPESESHEDALTLLFTIRQVLSDLSLNPLQDSRLNMYKSVVSNELSSLQNDPQYWLSIVTTRYVEGKDLNTQYPDKINAVTAAKVQEIISSLNNGSKVEYVVRQKH